MQDKRHLLGNEEKTVRLGFLYDVVAGCHKCEGMNLEKDDWKVSSLCVFGAGDVDAEVLLIGQSACTLCQETGYPFTKGSGDFLDECLEKIGLTRKEVFITNVVKCHPPSNRPSRPREIENCRSYLAQELQIIQPKLVVTLGRDALEWFMPVKSVMEEAGKIHRTLFFTIFSLPHPVTVIRRPEFRDKYLEMFTKISVLKGVL